MESVWSFVLIFAQVTAVAFGVFLATAIITAAVTAFRKRHGRTTH